MKRLLFILVCLPTLLYAQKQEQAYIDSLLKVLPSIRKATEHKEAFATCLGKIGESYFKMARTSKTGDRSHLGQKQMLQNALKYTDSAIHLFKSIGQLDDVVTLEPILAEIDSDLGNYKGAYMAEIENAALRDSISSLKTSQRIDSMSMKAEQEKKELLAMEELEKHKREKLFFGVLALFMLLFAGGLLYFLIYLRRSKQRIEEQKNRAEQSERFKQQFLANMSHEIRTPMNAVLGMTNLTLDTPLSPQQAKYLNAIKHSSENLLVIINDILDLSKMEAGKMEIEHIPFRLSDQVRQVYDTMQFKAQEKGLLLSTEINADVPDVISGDPSRLNQILINLCGNAIKFTDKGSIRVLVEKKSGTEASLVFRVVDQGIGIPADKIGKLFESFTQVDASTSRKYGGTGLGLSISKTLVELQGGKMEIKSVEGQGSEFSFTINYQLAHENAIIEASAKGKADTALLQGIRILIAEDNEYNQIVLKDTLESLVKDVRTDIGENGKLIIELLKQNDYDVILMDAQMPEMNGFEATAYIRSNMTGKKREIPIIALTASVLSTDIEKCLAAGMNAYVPKPFTRDELFNTLSRFYKNEHGLAVQTEQKEKQEDTTAGTPETDRLSDLTFLKKFCEGNETRMKKYIGIYVKATPGNLEKLSNAINSKDYNTVSITAHALKANLNYMGMHKTRDIAEKVELYAAEGKELGSLPEMIEQIISDCKKSVIELS